MEYGVAACPALRPLKGAQADSAQLAMTAPHQSLRRHMVCLVQDQGVLSQSGVTLKRGFDFILGGRLALPFRQTLLK